MSHRQPNCRLSLHPQPRLSPPCPTGCCSSKTGTYSASRRLGHRAYLTLVWLNLAANKSAHRSAGHQAARRLLPAPASRSRWPLANPPYETNPFPGGWEGKQEKLIRTVLRGTSDELLRIRSVNAIWHTRSSADCKAQQNRTEQNRQMLKNRKNIQEQTKPYLQNKQLILACGSRARQRLPADGQKCDMESQVGHIAINRPDKAHQSLIYYARAHTHARSAKMTKNMAVLRSL